MPPEGVSRRCPSNINRPSGQESLLHCERDQNSTDRPIVEKTVTSHDKHAGHQLSHCKPYIHSVQRHTIPRTSVVVWGAIAYEARSSLGLIQGSMTVQRNLHEFLQPHVLQQMARLAGAIFQQDNARPRTTRVSQG
ncbi:transposable element Tcb1 transposase [Trichonephila clavipes]|nr:transposable element Tcb1 transposase [Trichonephila clavipes]